MPLRGDAADRGTEKLTATVLRGKQFFYDARDTAPGARPLHELRQLPQRRRPRRPRLGPHRLRRRPAQHHQPARPRRLRQGFLHWSANFDEVQDFEGQIRALGRRHRPDERHAQFNTGTRSQPLGDRKAGVSADLDALAAYVGSLNTFDASPYAQRRRQPDAPRPRRAQAVFAARNCASCHGGTAFTNSGISNPQNIGTLKPASGQRLGGALTGIDVPTLRDVWATAPYLHDGSAPRWRDAIRAHTACHVTDTDLANLVAYLREIGSEETDGAHQQRRHRRRACVGQYFTNTTLAGTPVLQRTEAVNFDWGTGSPGAGVTADQFSVRWTGNVQAPATGSYRFQTMSDDGVRVWVNGVLVINNWTNHAPTTNNSASIALTGGTRYAITMEFYDGTGVRHGRLRWKRPGQTSFAAIPAGRLYAN